MTLVGDGAASMALVGDVTASMALVGDVTAFVYVGWVVLLVVSSATLLYVLYGRPEMVMYPGALKALTASMLLGVVGTVLETAYWAGFGGSDIHLAAWLVIFVGGSLFTGAMWLFAQDVVATDNRHAPFEDYAVEDLPGGTGPGSHDHGGDDVRDV